MKCRKCGRDFKDGQRFCPYCGERAEQIPDNTEPYETAAAGETTFCKKCGAIIPAGGEFCNRCGAQVNGMAPTDSPYSIYDDPGQPPKKNNRMPVIAVGIAAAVIVIIVAIFCILHVNSGKQGSDSESAENVDTQIEYASAMDGDLDIHSEPDKDSDVLKTVDNGEELEIIVDSSDNGWSELKDGGYVQDKFVVSDADDVLQVTKVNLTVYASAGDGSLTIRKKPSAKSGKKKSVPNGTKLSVNSKTDSNWGHLENGGWVNLENTVFDKDKVVKTENKTVNNYYTKTEEKQTEKKETSPSISYVDYSVVVDSGDGELNVRSEPTTNSTLLNTYYNGDVIAIDEVTDTNWGHLPSGGWIYLKYTYRYTGSAKSDTDNDSSDTFTVTVSSGDGELNVRSSPTKDSTLLNTYYNGDVLTIDKVSDNNWGHLVGGGWVDLDYTYR